MHYHLSQVESYMNLNRHCHLHRHLYPYLSILTRVIHPYPCHTPSRKSSSYDLNLMTMLLHMTLHSHVSNQHRYRWHDTMWSISIDEVWRMKNRDSAMGQSFHLDQSLHLHPLLLQAYTYQLHF